MFSLCSMNTAPIFMAARSFRRRWHFGVGGRSDVGGKGAVYGPCRTGNFAQTFNAGTRANRLPKITTALPSTERCCLGVLTDQRYSDPYRT
jgi:hypothetical protein